MTGIKSRIRDLEDKLGTGGEPIENTVNVRFLGDKEAHIIRVKHNPDGTVEHLGEKVKEWHGENTDGKAH